VDLSLVASIDNVLLQIRFGWTEAAMIAGAREVGVSPSIVGSFPRKEAALVEVEGSGYSEFTIICS
jgi:ubiquinone biosynthesis protein COQ9